jgi:hypothetical protein
MQSVLYDELKSVLSVCYFNNSRSHIIIRCPFCGDSDRSPQKGHFYICSQPPYLYKCHRCGESGLFTREVLSRLNIVNLPLCRHLTESSLQRVDRRGYRSLRNAPVSLPPYNTADQPRYRDKIQYLTSRLFAGFDDAHVMHVLSIAGFVPSLRYVLQNNTHLRVDAESMKTHAHDTRDLNALVCDLDDNYVGFINHSRTRAVFRYIGGDRRRPRYRNVVLLNDSNAPSDAFTVFAGRYNYKVDPVINIAEGILTMCGVYNYLVRQHVDVGSELFACGNSRSSLPQIYRWLSRCGFTNSRIRVWSDNDVPYAEWQRECTRVPFFRCSPAIAAYYNTRDDDFGVCIDSINPKREMPILKGQWSWNNLLF